MCFQPIPAHSAIYNERYSKRCRTLHCLAHDAFHLFALAYEHIDHYFVVYLQYDS